MDLATQALKFPLVVAVAAQLHSDSDWAHPEEARWGESPPEGGTVTHVEVQMIKWEPFPVSQFPLFIPLPVTHGDPNMLEPLPLPIPLGI